MLPPPHFGLAQSTATSLRLLSYIAISIQSVLIYHDLFQKADPIADFIMEMEIDPEIAAQMGFSSFGGTTKRKFAADEAFTDVQQDAPAAREPTQTAANAVPVASVKGQNRPAEEPVAGESLSPAESWSFSLNIV